MKFASSTLLFRQFPWRTFPVTFIPSSLLLLLVGLQDFIPISTLAEDITTLAGVPLYTGALSQIGIVLWAITGGICFFSVYIARDNREQESLRLFLLLCGCLTAFLMVDDLFRVHERVLPVLFSIPQAASQGAYAAMTLALMLAFRKVILGNDTLFLFLAAIFFALSLTDEFLPLIRPLAHFTAITAGFFESGCKLLGIVSWLAYLSGLSAKLVDAEHRYQNRTAA